MKILNKKIAVGLLLGSLCVASVGTAVFANSPNNQEGTPSQICQNFKGDKHAHPMMQDAKEKLDKLAKDGVISEEQAGKLVSFFEEKGKEMQANMEKMQGMSQEERKAYFQQMREQHPDFIGEIKNAAALSDDQAKAVISALRPHKPMMNPEQLSQKLNNLVTAGTISQDQADSIVSFFKDKAAEHKAEWDKVQQMSQEERKAYFAEKCKNRPDIIKELKSAVNLTDEQAKAVADSLRPQHGQHGHGPQTPANQ
jgi:polyhydroxyalkanoate synthesis regulator phasin